MTNTIANALWNRIKDFEFGLSEASLSFTDRLSRENGWDAPYAERVVDEYRRFCFLAMAAGHPVTPSEQVDQVWHLHLLYTENYWTGILRRGPATAASITARPVADGAKATNIVIGTRPRSTAMCGRSAKSRRPTSGPA